MAFEHRPPADGETAHPAGPQQLWAESWYFDFSASDGSIGGYIRVARYPNLRTAWYWAAVVGPDRPTVLVVDHEVPLASGPSPLELRSTGLWADHNVETAYEHVSIGLEAFGVAIDDPTEAYRGLRGDRTPLGFDLEWETDGDVHFWGPGFDHYEIPCNVHGEILVGDETIELDGRGQRDHAWGERNWWDRSWCWAAFGLDDGTRVQVVYLDDLGYATGFVQGSGTEPRVIHDAFVESELGPDGIPTAVAATIDGVRYTFEPIGWAPVQVLSPGGREARLPRALVRVAGPGLEGSTTTGTGWIELNQPPI